MQSRILHRAIPSEQVARAAARLPSVAPVEGPWLRMDEMYDAQMAERRRLMAAHREAVYAQLPEGVAAARGFLRAALAALPAGFEVGAEQVVCPDGVVVPIEWDAPLWSLGAILQQDVCILEKQGEAHVLTGAILCFPASWTLAQKVGKPLIGIHKPVESYDGGIAARVQRLFDGVKPGRPLWRANHLRYDDPALFQPRREDDPRPVSGPNARYLRSERQVILRVTEPDAVAFVIHTVVAEIEVPVSVQDRTEQGGECCET